MRLRPGIILFLLLFGFWTGVRGEPAAVVSKVAAPDWVVDHPVDLAAKEPVEGLRDGSWILLIDEQTNGSSVTAYEHCARKFTTQNAIRSASRIEVSFNPAYQTLTWHKLVVYRDGQVLDRLPQQGIRVLSREENLDENLYDGSVSAVIELEDLKVGDVVEYAYSIQGANPIFAGKYSDSFSTTWSSPVHQLRIRLLWPEGRALSRRERLKRLQTSTEEKTGGLRDLRWGADDLPVLLPESSTPAWDLPIGWLQLSEYQSWGEVVQWALEHYKINDPLPEKLNPVMDKIRALPTEEARILAALEYVQDEIRYLSISEGVHSHEPYTMAEVVQRGFGDCKDKARLLSAMLRSLGLDAAPALVNTSFEQGIAEWLPTPTDFDHVVVRLKLPEKTYWLDATMSHQRGPLAERFFPDYGKALVIEEGGKGLTTVAPGGYEAGSTSSVSRYVVKAYNEDVKLKVHLTYRGYEADTVRMYLANESVEEIGKDMLNFRARLHPGIREDGKLAVHDDPQANEITIDQNYLIHDFWQNQQEDTARLATELYAFALRDDLAAPDEPRRSFPLAVTHPRTAEQVLIFEFPDDSKFKAKSETIRDAAFSYSRDVSQSGRVLTIRHQYRSRGNEVSPQEMEKYLGHLKEARDLLDYVITIPKELTLPGAKPTAQPEPPPLPQGVNWPLAVFALVVLGLSVAGAVMLYFWKPRYYARYRDRRLEGLGGWLILFGLGLVFGPVARLPELKGIWAFMQLEMWARVTMPGQPHYHPMWSFVMYFETCSVIIVTVFNLLLIVLFFQKRFSFPILMIWMFVLLVSFSIMDYLLLYSFTPETQGPAFIRNIIAALVWGSYLKKSKRVEATFVHGGRRMEGEDPALQQLQPPPLPQPVREIKLRERRPSSRLTGWSAGLCLGAILMMVALVILAVAAQGTRGGIAEMIAVLCLFATLGLGIVGLVLAFVAVKEERGWSATLILSVVGNGGITGLLGLALAWGVVQAASERGKRAGETLAQATPSASPQATPNVGQTPEHVPPPAEVAATPVPTPEPQSPDAWYAQGKEQAQEEHWKQASESFGRAIEGDPSQVQPWIDYMSACRKADGDFEAEEKVQALVKRYPDLAVGWYVLGAMQADEGMPTMGIETLKKAIQIDPHFALAHNAMGLTYLQLKNAAQAKECFIAACEADPQGAEFLNNLGYSLLQEGALDAAIENFQKAQAAQPHHERSLVNLISAYKLKGSLDLAAKTCDTLAETNPALAAQARKELQ